MLDYSVKIGFILLQRVFDGDSIGFVDLGEVDDLFIFLAEDNVAQSDDLGSLRAYYLGIFARLARKEKFTIAKVSDVGGKDIGGGTGIKVQ